MADPTPAAQELDDLIQTTRASTPVAALEKRAVPRSTIAELNQLDPEQLRDRLLNSHRDSRGPLTKVLDLVDAPRNAVLNVLAPSIAREKAERGETAAFGMGRVNTSDVLRHLGVNNNIAASVLGFVGDVALDPLTYLGPAGWGAQFGKNVTEQGVRSVAFRAAGARAMARSIGEHAATGAVRDPVWAKVIAQSIAEHPTVGAGVDALRAAGDIAGAESMLASHIRGPLTTGPVGRAFSRVGGTLDYGDGYLARKFNEPGTNAVKEAVERYGRGTEPGLRIGVKPGEAGSAVAHIPFTDYSIQVPAFTAGARTAVRSLQIAKDASGINRAVLDGAPEARAMLNSMQEFRSAQEAQADQVAGMAKAEIDYHNDLPNLKIDHDLHVAMFGTGSHPSPLEEATARMDLFHGEHPVLMQQYTDRMKAARDAMAGHMERLDPAAFSSSVQGVNDFLHLEGAYREAQAGYEAAEAQQDFYRRVGEFAKTGADYNQMAPLLAGDPAEWRKLLATAEQRPEDFEKVVDSLSKLTAAQHDYADILGGQIAQVSAGPESVLREMAKESLGTGDNAIATSLFAPMGRLIERVAGDDNTVSRALYRLDQKARRNLNMRGGFQAQKINGIKNQLRGVPTAQELVLARRRGQIGRALESAGLSPKGDLFDKAIQVIHARMYQMADPGGAIYHWTKFGSGGDSELLTALKDLKAGGIFDKTLHPTLMNDLDAIAADSLEKIRALGLAEQEDDLLELPMAGHIPIGFSRAGADARRAQSQREAAMGGRLGAGREPFQKKRTTWQTRFTDSTGKPRRFFEFQREFEGATDKALAIEFKNDPAGLAKATEIRDTFREWNALPQDVRDTIKAKPTDPWELNALWRDGTFNRLVGTDRTPEALFDLDFTAREAIRHGQHQRAVGKRGLLDLVTWNGMNIPEDHLLRIAGSSKTATLGNGVKVSILPDVVDTAGQKVAAVQIGDQVFRRLGTQAMDQLRDSLLSINGQDIRGMVFNDKFADKFEDMIRATSFKGQANDLLKAADMATRIWKGAALFRPSWFVFNMVGDMANSVAGGARLDHIIKRMPELIRLRMAMNDPAKLAGMTFKFGGQTMGGPQALDFLIRNRAFNENLPLEFAAHVFGDSPNLWRTHSSMFRKFLAGWFRLNGAAADVQRAAAFLSHLDEGNDASAASQKMLRSMLDYADFSNVEEQYFRRLIPFYSWMRGNLGYQLHSLFQRPSYAALAPKLKEAIEEATAGEATVPEALRPSWMRDHLAAQIGKDPSKRFSVLVADALPTSDLYAALTPLFGTAGAMQFAHYFTSGINPVLTAVPQIGSGTEFFSGRTIGADEASGDIGAGQFLASQFGPYAEWGPGGRFWKSLRQGPGSAAGRFLVGGREQAFDEDRLSTNLERQYKEEETRLQAATHRAERDGDTGASLLARTRLMELYQEKMRLGLKVPKWAVQWLMQQGMAPEASTLRGPGTPASRT